MYFQTNDGVRLAYTDCGDGQPVILLSGYSGIKEEWEQQSVVLKSNGFRVITLDWRSHGDSTRTSKNLRIMRLATDLWELLQYIGAKQVVLVGHSMGASVIWAYVMLFGQRNIGKIITIDESPKALNDQYWSCGIKGMNWENFEIMAQQLMNQKMTLKGIPSHIATKIKIQHLDNPFNYDVGLELLKDHLLQDWRQLFKQIKIPQLMLIGKESVIWNGDYSKFCENESNVSFEVIKISESGHFPQLEQADIVNQCILNFLN